MKKNKRAAGFFLLVLTAGLLGWASSAEAGVEVGKVIALVQQLFGGQLSLSGATAGQAPVKQADGSWAPGSPTPSSAGFDTTFGTTQGSLIYRNATTWVALTPGTSGQVLQSGGAGANPSWIANMTSSTWADVLANGVASGANSPQITTGSLLRFGGATSSFTALKPNGTTLALRFADDTDGANFSSNSANFTNALTNGVSPLTVDKSPSSGVSGKVVDITAGSNLSGQAVDIRSSGAATGVRVTLTGTSSGVGLQVDQTAGGTGNLLEMGPSPSFKFSVTKDGLTTITPTPGTTALSLVGGTLTVGTGSAPPFTITQTWNDVSSTVQFIGPSIDTTVTAAAATSRLFRIRGGAAGTTERFAVKENGAVFGNGQILTDNTDGFLALTIDGTTAQEGAFASLKVASSYTGAFLANGIVVGSTSARTGYAWYNTSLVIDTALLSPSAGVLKISDNSTTNYLQLGSGGVRYQAAGLAGWSSTTDATAAADVAWARQGAAGIIGVLNPNSLTSSAAIRVYNTTDVAGGAPTNSEYINFQWVTNTARITTAKTGTGSIRTLQIGGGDITSMTFESGGTYFPSANGFNIGAAGARTATMFDSTIGVQSAWTIQWYSASTLEGGSVDTTLSRSSAGVLRFGTTTANSSGSWLATNGTLSGSLTTTQLIDSGKVINTTAGDSATIDAYAGRFRKDTSGTTFTLTNNKITANSIIVLTPANAALGSSVVLNVSAGAGSATITFARASLVTGQATAEAPAADFDVNFVVVN